MIFVVLKEVVLVVHYFGMRCMIFPFQETPPVTSSPRSTSWKLSSASPTSSSTTTSSGSAEDSKDSRSEGDEAAVEQADVVVLESFGKACARVPRNHPSANAPSRKPSINKTSGTSAQKFTPQPFAEM